jgi:hypothetical protein
MPPISNPMSDEDSWADVISAAKECPWLEVSHNSSIGWRFDDENIIEIVSCRNFACKIANVFTGQFEDVTHNQATEFIQQIRLLPAPTYPEGIETKSDLDKRMGDYYRVDVPRSIIYAVICNEYILIRDRKCYRVVVSGSPITLYRKTFPYDMRAFVKMIIRERRK